MSGNKGQIIKAIVLIISLLSIMFTATFAWFQYKNDSNVDEFSSNAIKVNDTKVSLDGENWGMEADFTELDGFAFQPVCGNGNIFFTRDTKVEQQTDENGNIIYVDKFDDTYTAVEQPQSVVAMTDFYVKANNDVHLFWDGRSYIIPAIPNYEQLLANGTIHKDLIAGAMRVALLVADQPDIFRVVSVWIPNSCYQAIYTDETRVLQNFTLTGTPETDYKFYTSPTGVIRVKTNDMPNGYYRGGTEDNPIHYFWGDLNSIAEASTTPIVTLLEGVTHFRLVVWLEGTDREAVNYFAGGSISSSVVFTTELVEETDN